MEEIILARFGHHPDPAIDFEIEVDCLTGLAYNQHVGFEPVPDLSDRIDRALEFRVGGVPRCIASKNALRELRKSVVPA